jgi:hypothetical protein
MKAEESRNNARLFVRTSFVAGSGYLLLGALMISPSVIHSLALSA